MSKGISAQMRVSHTGVDNFVRGLTRFCSGSVRSALLRLRRTPFRH